MLTRGRRHRAPEFPALPGRLSDPETDPDEPDTTGGRGRAPRRQANALADARADRIAGRVGDGGAGRSNPFVFLLAIFLMACFVGYYVVWNVTPALHSPLMAVTNAISSVIIVGAMLATGLAHVAAGRSRSGSSRSRWPR